MRISEIDIACFVLFLNIEVVKVQTLILRVYYFLYDTIGSELDLLALSTNTFI